MCMGKNGFDTITLQSVENSETLEEYAYKSRVGVCLYKSLLPFASMDSHTYYNNNAVQDNIICAVDFRVCHNKLTVNILVSSLYCKGKAAQ